MKFNDLLFPYLRDVLENQVPPIEELIPFPFHEHLLVFPELQDPWCFVEIEESDLLLCAQLFQDHLRNGTRKQKILDAVKNAARDVADGLRFCGIKNLDTQDRFDLNLVDYDEKVRIDSFYRSISNALQYRQSWSWKQEHDMYGHSCLFPGLREHFESEEFTSLMNDVKAILRFVQDQRDAVALEHSARKAFSSWTECDHPLIGLDAGTAAVDFGALAERNSKLSSVAAA